MPVMECQSNGKPGFKFGESGTCYTYTAGDDTSKEAARTKAVDQGKAIEANKSATFDIVKTDNNNNLAFGWAYVAITKEGEQVYDHSGEFVSDVDSLEMAAYAFNLAYRKSGEIHIGDAKGYLVESLMVTKEKLAKLGLPEDALPQGLWVGFHFPDDEVFAKVREGRYKMFSIQGTALKEEVID